MDILTTSFLMDGTIGDCWASLASVQQYHKLTGKKALFYLTNGRLAKYYEGAVHPTKNEENQHVMLNKRMIDMMIPLLKEQPYIEDAKMHSEELIHVDLNRIRETFVNMPYHALQRWYHYVYPDMSCDLSKQYIYVPDSDKNIAKEKLIVCRTERYQNQNIDYSFLKEYGNDVVFAGTDLEYNLFKLRFGLTIEHLQVNDFLELAQAIKQAKGVLSNQTQIFQLAEGMKTPRVVELCRFAPNVEPIGEMAFEFYAQEAAEYFTRILMMGSIENALEYYKTKKATEAAS